MRTLLGALAGLALFLPAMAQETSPYTRTFHFEIKAPAASSVVLEGKAAGAPVEVPLRKTRGGDWFVNADLPVGRLEYVFVVDGSPVLDEQSPSEDDGKGGLRSFFLIDDDRDAQPLDSGTGGRVERREVPSKALGRNIPVNVYMPPGYETKYGYPVLLLLHGFEMNESQWLTGGIANYLDRFILSGEFPPAVAVMPGVPSDFYTGKTEEFITKELFKWLRKNYSLQKAATQNAVGGMSMGGFGAFSLAYRHPELFGHAMILSPGTRDTTFLDQLDRDLRDRRKIEATLDIRCGKGDTLVLPFAQGLEAVLAARKVPHRYEVTRGGHDWDYWRSVLKPALSEVAKSFKKPIL